jgi:hypothetical protein
VRYSCISEVRFDLRATLAAREVLLLTHDADARKLTAARER